MAVKDVAPATVVSGTGQPSPERVRAQLTKILDSKTFVQSERLSRFLRLAVDCALAGDTDRIKEYTVGLEVFDRPHDFDPRIDSIVRVEASRLRRKLREYYDEAGAGDPVIIQLRRGSYVPIFSYSTPPGSPAPPAPPLNARTVAVLPFLNISPDSDQDFFCDGITEEILNRLAAIPQLNVVALTSVFHFKGLTADVREIGKQLGAGTVIEGSVRKSGDRLRISAKAIDATKGLLLWSDAFDREVTDVFAVQDDIARAVADALRVSLVPPREGLVRTRRYLEAYTAYLKGCHYWNHVAQEGVQAAINEFTRAISLFPNYAPSYAGLATVYAHLTFWGVIPPAEGIAQARQAALDALRLDEEMAGAHAILGIITACCEWDWEQGTRLLRRATELQPSNMTAHSYQGFLLLCHGQFPELTAELDKTSQLDPLSPWSFRNRGWYYYYRRQYDQAIEVFKTALALDPRFREAQFMLAYAYLRERHYDEAIAQLLELPVGPFDAARWGALGEAYACSGNQGGSRDALNQLDALARTSYVSPMYRLGIHAVLGEWDRAFEEMEQAHADHCPWLCLLKVDPRYEPVRSDPRFTGLLQRMRLS
jgi:adenylate cyclase